MDKEKIVNEYGIEIAIEKISQKINEKFDEFSKTNDDRIKEEIIDLIEDREKVYSNDKKIIEKYL